ncbi:SDR family oxidoreductase [Patulibacter sp. NPDC049589]|uniref:SDR family NAD(P)-dependent oxidoreductase n=1 Tax=Patulibacter sp. NPDC049589 TaxID=3154731 RepID=UPI00341395EB
MTETSFRSLDLTGKSIIVTGAASGIGRATAILLAARGASVAVADFDEAGGAETVEQITTAGGTARFFRTDVSQEDSVAALVAGTVEAFGGLHGAFNNAGIGPQSALHETTLEEWNRAIGINLTGVFLSLKHEIAYMVEHGGGAIVNTSSLAANNTVPGMPGYIASKTGVIGLTRSASLDYAKRGIRVNVILPGSIRTPMLGAVMEDPVLAAQLEATQPLGDPIDIAEQAAWLLSDAAKFTTGTQFIVDGGASVV